MITGKNLTAFLAGLALLTSARAGLAQDANVYKNISTERLEDLMKGMGIDFKKNPSATNKNTIFYAFERNKYKMSLHYYGGDDIMLVADFNAASLATINQWNRGAKFSRAVLYQDAKGEFSSLEANLDVAGGVTDAAVKHFFKRYDEEVKKFDQSLARGGAQDEDVFKGVTSDRLEAILKDMKVEYKKTVGNNKAVVFFDYEKNNYKFRLTNFGGADLMIDVVFKKLPLEQINKYNVGRKFVRAVLYRPPNANEYTALEANLDCVGGVSEGILRYFIRTFDDEARSFDKFLSK